MNFELVHGSDLDTGSLGESGSSLDTDYNDFDKQERNYMLIGYSHKPYIRIVGNTTILNPGSAGQPKDFNPRASYAFIENGVPYIKRASYDIERMVMSWKEAHYPNSLQVNYLQCFI